MWRCYISGMPTPSEHTNPEPEKTNNPSQPDLSKEGMTGPQQPQAGGPADGAGKSAQPDGSPADGIGRTPANDGRPDLAGESFPIKGKETGKPDVFAALKQSMNDGHVLDLVAEVRSDTAHSEGYDKLIDQSLAPVVDDEARAIIRLADRGQLPSDVERLVMRLCDYYTTWGKALTEHTVAWNTEGGRGAEEDRLTEFTIPPHYLRAVEAADRVRLAHEERVAPPLDAKALDLIRRYAAGELPKEVEDRIDRNVHRYLGWQTAVWGEFARQGKEWA
jgi:hypothetical protein